ncbi:hypothetical protein VTO42DRAFT_1688 [Malbranchea cinnamomea]
MTDAAQPSPRFRSRLSSLSTPGRASFKVDMNKGRTESHEFRVPPSNLSELERRRSLGKSTQNSPRSAKTSSRNADPSPPPKGSGARVRGPRASIDIQRLSGSTFGPMDSDLESHEMDPGLMLDALPHLLLISDEILKTLAPPNFSDRKLQKVISSLQFKKKVLYLDEAFEFQKKLFGKEHYINVDLATRALPSVKHLQWEPALLWNKANLARLSLDIINQLIGSFQDSVLFDLDQCFPSPFICTLPSSDDSQESFRSDTFRTGLAIRIQCCLASLRRAQSSNDTKDPADILEDTFISPSLGEDEQFRGWNLDGLQTYLGDLPQDLAGSVSDYVNTIRRAFRGNEIDKVDFDQLDAEFPLFEFVGRLTMWIRARADTIDKEIAEQEPLEVVISRLKRELEGGSELASPVDRETGEGETSAFISPEETHLQGQEENSQLLKSFQSKKWSQHLARKYRASLSGDSMSLHRHEGHNTPNDAVKEAGLPRGISPQQGSLYDGEEDQGSSSPLSVGDVMSKIQSVTQDQWKRPVSTEARSLGRGQHSPQDDATEKSLGLVRRSFYDRQAGAERVSPVVDSEGEVSGRIRSRKRGASIFEEDDESSAFEEDRRQVDVVRNQKRARKRARIVIDDDDDNDDGHQPLMDAGLNDSQNDSLVTSNHRCTVASATGTTQVQSKRQRSLSLIRGSDNDNSINGGDSRPSEGRRSTPSQGREISDERSSQSPDEPRAVFPSRRRERVFWTIEETKRLIALIGRYGPKWSKIKEKDAAQPEPKLGRRSQVNLKDKARNLAFDYYKRKQELPKNFHLVPLTTEQKKQLQDMGIKVRERH